MRIDEPGHVYALENIDVKENDPTHQLVVFVNREGKNNHHGVQTQEVLRMLIDRTMHCDRCLPHGINKKIVYHLRMALVLHESRALERKVEKGLIAPETMEINRRDGHFLIASDPKAVSNDAVDWIYRRESK